MLENINEKEKKKNEKWKENQNRNYQKEKKRTIQRFVHKRKTLKLRSKINIEQFFHI